jgi:hypothetical protein
MRVELGNETADAFGAARIRIGAYGTHEFGQHIVGFEEALRARAFISEFGGGLLPGAVDFAQHVVVRDEGILEDHLVEFAQAAHLPDLIAGNARRVFMSTRNDVRPWRRFSLVGADVRNSPIM